MIQQGGVMIDEEKVTDPKIILEKRRFEKGVIIKKGKKVYHKATI